MKTPPAGYESISDFSSIRQQDRGTVNAWIRCHDEVNSACQMIGKEKYIDTSSEAYKLLEKQYPLPKPIEIIVDNESRNKLLQAQELIIRLQEQLREKDLEIAQKGAVQLLLEDKEKQLAAEQEARRLDQERSDRREREVKEWADQREREAKEQADRERLRAEEAERKLAEAETKAKEAEDKAARMENAGFWARLRKKW